MTFLDFVRLTRANALIILGGVTLGVLVMFGYTLRQPVVYTASTTGYVVVGTAQTPGELATNQSIAQDQAQLYASLISDRRVAQGVIDQLGLDTSPESIAGLLSAFAPPENSQITISASAGDAAEARDLANAAVKSLGEVAQLIANGATPEAAAQSEIVKLVPGEEALLPSVPTSPDYQRNLALGAGAGLLLGYAVALMRRSVDRRIRTVANVEEAGAGPVIGLLPTADPLSKRHRGVEEDLGVVAEGFRQLRTNLRFVDVDHPPRSIVITSAQASEGKSTVSSNLAKMMAAAGQPTLLVDADLRRPSLATTFNLDPTVGLTQVLVGDVLVQDVLQQTTSANLHVMAAGRIPPNPSELLGSQRMHALIDDLTEEFVVILDAPPLLPVTDAGLLSVTADGAILVIAVGKTTVEQVELCKKVLGQVGGKLLGSVLNLAPSRGMGSVVYGYGYGSYEQGYGDGPTDKSRRGRRSAKDQVGSAETASGSPTPGAKKVAPSDKSSQRSKAAS